MDVANKTSCALTHNAAGHCQESCAGGVLPPLTDAPTWLIDPIDGTTNFVHTFPFTCVSIAFAVGGQVVLGVVYNPILEELFVAARGHGAFLNSKPISCSSCTQLSQAIVVRARQNTAQSAT